MSAIIFTISSIRVLVLIAFMFYFLFEKNLRRAIYVLCVVLMIPNLVAIYMEITGP